MNEKEVNEQKAGDTIGDKKDLFLATRVYETPSMDERTVGLIESTANVKRFYEQRSDGKIYCLVDGCRRNREPLDSYEKFYQHFIDMHCTKSSAEHMHARYRMLMRSEKIKSREFFHMAGHRSRYIYTDEMLRKYSICPVETCSKKIRFTEKGHGQPDVMAEKRHLKEHGHSTKRMIDMHRLYNFNKDNRNENRIERLRAGKHGGTRFGRKERKKDNVLFSAMYQQLINQGCSKKAAFEKARGYMKDQERE